MGCGNGTPAIRLAQACDVEVVGISVSERQVARGNERAAESGLADRVRFERVDAMHLPYEAESFDGAWAIESMFHMPDKAQVLSGVARVLRSGGRFPIADLVHRKPTADSSGPTTYSSLYASLTELGEYPKVIETAGLTPVEVTDITRGDVPFGRLLRRLDAFPARAVRRDVRRHRLRTPRLQPGGDDAHAGSSDT